MHRHRRQHAWKNEKCFLVASVSHREGLDLNVVDIGVTIWPMDFTELTITTTFQRVQRNSQTSMLTTLHFEQQVGCCATTLPTRRIPGTWAAVRQCATVG